MNWTTMQYDNYRSSGISGSVLSNADGQGRHHHSPKVYWGLISSLHPSESCEKVGLICIYLERRSWHGAMWDKENKCLFWYGYSNRISGWKLSLSFRVRTSMSRGLLLWAGRKWMTSASDFISVGLRNGFVSASFSLGSGQTTIAYNITAINDGRWHHVHFFR